MAERVRTRDIGRPGSWRLRRKLASLDTEIAKTAKPTDKELNLRRTGKPERIAQSDELAEKREKRYFIAWEDKESIERRERPVLLEEFLTKTIRLGEKVKAGKKVRFSTNLAAISDRLRSRIPRKPTEEEAQSIIRLANAAQEIMNGNYILTRDTRESFNGDITIDTLIGNDRGNRVWLQREQIPTGSLSSRGDLRYIAKTNGVDQEITAEMSQKINSFIAVFNRFDFYESEGRWYPLATLVTKYGQFAGRHKHTSHETYSLPTKIQ